MQSRLKVKNRQSRDVIVGAVTGSLRRPAAVIAGLMRDGELTVAGRTTELAAGQASELGAVMTVAAADHPWPERISAGVFGSRRCQQPPKIDPWLRLKIDPRFGHFGFSVSRLVAHRPNGSPRTPRRCWRRWPRMARPVCLAA